MENNIKKKYAGEIIPDPLELLQEIKQLTKSVNKLPLYGFLELFTEVERKGNIEYHRNNSIWPVTCVPNGIHLKHINKHN